MLASGGTRTNVCHTLNTHKAGKFFTWGWVSEGWGERIEVWVYCSDFNPGWTLGSHRKLL